MLNLIIEYVQTSGVVPAWLAALVLVSFIVYLLLVGSRIFQQRYTAG